MLQSTGLAHLLRDTTTPPAAVTEVPFGLVGELPPPNIEDALPDILDANRRRTPDCGDTTEVIRAFIPHPATRSHSPTVWTRPIPSDSSSHKRLVGVTHDISLGYGKSAKVLVRLWQTRYTGSSLWYPSRTIRPPLVCAGRKGGGQVKGSPSSCFDIRRLTRSAIQAERITPPSEAAQIPVQTVTSGGLDLERVVTARGMIGVDSEPVPLLDSRQAWDYTVRQANRLVCPGLLDAANQLLERDNEEPLTGEFVFGTTDAGEFLLYYRLEPSVVDQGEYDLAEGDVLVQQDANSLRVREIGGDSLGTATNLNDAAELILQYYDQASKEVGKIWLASGEGGIKELRIYSPPPPPRESAPDAALTQVMDVFVRYVDGDGYERKQNWPLLSNGRLHIPPQTRYHQIVSYEVSDGASDSEHEEILAFLDSLNLRISVQTSEGIVMVPSEAVQAAISRSIRYGKRPIKQEGESHIGAEDDDSGDVEEEDEEEEPQKKRRSKKRTKKTPKKKGKGSERRQSRRGSNRPSVRMIDFQVAGQTDDSEEPFDEFGQDDD